MRIQERKDECVIELKWLYAIEEEPPQLIICAWLFKLNWAAGEPKFR
jgi:hypothetical protein